MDLCQVASSLLRDKRFRLVVTAKIVCSFTACATLIMQLRNYHAIWVIHKHSKILFTTYLYCNIFYSALFTAHYSYELWRIVNADECPLFTYTVIFFGRGIALLGIQFSMAVMTLLSLERLYAVLYPVRFERGCIDSKAPLVHMLLALGACTIIISMTIWPDLHVNWIVPRAFGALTIPENSDRYQIVNFLMLGNSLLSLVIFHISLWINFRRNEPKDASVALQYQIRENKRILSSLIPLEYAQALTFLVTYTALDAFSLRKFMGDAVQWAVILEIVTVTPYFPLFLSIVIFMKRKKKAARIVPVSTMDEADAYFHDLALQWS